LPPSSQSPTGTPPELLPLPEELPLPLPEELPLEPPLPLPEELPLDPPPLLLPEELPLDPPPLPLPEEPVPGSLPLLLPEEPPLEEPIVPLEEPLPLLPQPPDPLPELLPDPPPLLEPLSLPASAFAVGVKARSAPQARRRKGSVARKEARMGRSYRPRGARVPCAPRHPDGGHEGQRLAARSSSGALAAHALRLKGTLVFLGRNESTVARSLSFRWGSRKARLRKSQRRLEPPPERGRGRPRGGRRRDLPPGAASQGRSARRDRSSARNPRSRSSRLRSLSRSSRFLTG
jgi:hypothetical protein